MAENNNILGEESFTRATTNLPAYILGEDEIKLEDVKLELDDACLDFLPIGQRWELLPIDKLEENNKETNKMPVINLRLDPGLCTCSIRSKKPSVVTRSMSKKHQRCLPLYK